MTAETGAGDGELPQDPETRRTTAPLRRRHTIIGALAGLMVIPPETDLTEPADPSWGEAVENGPARDTEA